MTEESLFVKLAEAAYQNRLVLFLGTGFSKAVLGYDPNAANHYDQSKASVVPSWIELVRRSRKSLGLEVTEVDSGSTENNIDCPLDASCIVRDIVNKDGVSGYEASRRLKDTIADLTDFYPSPEQIVAFQKSFLTIKPQLVITTNYDDIVETILHTGFSSFGPEQVLHNLPDGMIPIYHLHGMRQRAESIVITREDYVQALRYSTYRQQRLASIMRENVVVYIGYNKNDINVLTAIDASRNVFSDVGKMSDAPHVYVSYSKEPTSISATGDDVFTVNYLDTYAFFETLANACESYRGSVKNRLSQFETRYKNLLKLNDEAAVKILRDKSDDCSKLIKHLAELIERGDENASRYRGYLTILLQGLYNASRSSSYMEGNFEAYKYCTFLIIQLLQNMNVLGIRSYFFHLSMVWLEDVAGYIGTGRGKSWSAHSFILSEWGKIDGPIVEAVKSSANRHNRLHTLELIETLEKEIEDKESLAQELQGL